MLNLTKNPPGGRGCGRRTSGSGYLCCGTSSFGLPIEVFLIDPCVVWPNEWQRGMKVIPRGSDNLVNDVLVFVAKSDYPSPWDFVTEVSLYGASRKFSPTFPFHKLTPGRSRMVFAHARALPAFSYILDRMDAPLRYCRYDHRFREAVDLLRLNGYTILSNEDPTIPFWPNVLQVRAEAESDHRQLWQLLRSKSYLVTVGSDTVRIEWDVEVQAEVVPGFHEDDSSCALALRDLAYLVSPKVTTEVTGGSQPNRFSVEGPSFSYGGIVPADPSLYCKPDDRQWATGLFLSVPLTHVEYTKRENVRTADRAQRAGYQTVVLDY